MYVVFRRLVPLHHLKESAKLCWQSAGFVSSLASRFNSVKPATESIFFKHGNLGLFGIPELCDHTGFYLLRENVQRKAHQLLTETQSPHRKRKLVQVFDDLSDVLCRVADMADFVRIAHPEARYRQAAEDACMAVSSIVQEMNTNVELYSALQNVVLRGDKLSEKPLDDIDMRVARLLLDDFEQCGIHLPDAKRKAFVQLTENVMMLETMFQKGAHKPTPLSLQILPSYLRSVFGGSKKDATITSMHSESPDERIREATYRLYLRNDPHQSHILDSLLATRDQLAKLVGFRSYSERALKGTMTETAEKAMLFLTTLSKELRPMTDQDFVKMQNIKASSELVSLSLKPWDVPFCSAVMRHQYIDVSQSDLASYLPLGSCMEGLANLVQNLYNVTLRDVTPDPGECWHYSVRKLEVVSYESPSDVIGIIYCDLFDRYEKPHQDCHFTIQGGRLRDDGIYQIPKVVIMMSLTEPTGGIPTLLCPQQLDNLFHEFGHAMHSMLGRTRYQHVTGTRCSTDFAEVPSILMEYFASDSRVLKSFARHYETGESMPERIMQQMCQSKAVFVAADTQLQVFYSILDLKLHGQHPLHAPTIDILAETQTEHYGLPYVPDTAWHLRFGHLVGYGAKYFAYLMSRSIATSIWQHCFKKDPFSRMMGERYKLEVLSQGGQKPPANMVEALTGEKLTVESLVRSLMEETKASGGYK